MNGDSSSYSRRDLLFGRVFRRPPPPPPPPPRVIPLLRPPGAGAEEEFLATCTQCGDCLPACPYHALFLAPARYGRAAGTPMLDLVQQPCWMCAETPCIGACAPGALRREPGTFPRIGVAVIQLSDCLAFQGTTCTTCVERCPAPGALNMQSGLPQVVEERCTGCGVCQHVCPAPGAAIQVQPIERTGPPAPYDGL
jgi:ferredoxin-type protein NapG